MTPELKSPAMPIPASFSTQGGLPMKAGIESATKAMGWRNMFGDPRLQQLINLALQNNRDLLLATLNVEAAQAISQVQVARRLPSVSVDATSTRERTVASTNEGTSSREISKQVDVSLGISAFELDLFGRVRALSDASLARYFASENGREAVQISLVGTVANTYFAQQLAGEQLELAERTLADWRESLELARRMKAAKQKSELDIVQAESQVALAEANVQAHKRTFAQAGNALQLVVGSEQPNDLPPALPLERQPVSARLPAGLSADVLLTRPDIRQAEQLLKAANADIGAARAAFFPQLSLTASFGYASSSLGGLFNPSRQVWRFVPQVTQPLFQGGRLRAELNLAKVRKSEAIAQYERAIQTAFREVADALAGTATFDKQIDAQLRAVNAAERGLVLSNLRYQVGVDSRLQLLNAQRTLYSTREILLELRRDDIVNTVALYKSLGGGLQDWSGTEFSGASTID
jgi:NodT family efflux transporter outer membrane factor (OMF) lipoprotein